MYIVIIYRKTKDVWELNNLSPSLYLVSDFIMMPSMNISRQCG